MIIRHPIHAIHDSMLLAIAISLRSHVAAAALLWKTTDWYLQVHATRFQCYGEHERWRRDVRGCGRERYYVCPCFLSFLYLMYV
jgi:hypothetical protein